MENDPTCTWETGAMLARQRGDMVLPRRARRGLAAAKRLKGDISGAIRHLERVLEMSKVGMIRMDSILFILYTCLCSKQSNIYHIQMIDS